MGRDCKKDRQDKHDNCDKEKRHFYSVTVKKLKVCMAKIKEARIEKATIKDLETEELKTLNVKANLGTFREIIVTGENVVEPQRVGSQGVTTRETDEFGILHEGCVVSDYMLVNNNTEMVGNLRAKGKVRVHKYQDPSILNLERSISNLDHSEDLSESFDLAETIDCILKRLDCIEYGEYGECSQCSDCSDCPEEVL